MATATLNNDQYSWLQYEAQVENEEDMGTCARMGSQGMYWGKDYYATVLAATRYELRRIAKTSGGSTLIAQQLQESRTSAPARIKVSCVGNSQYIHADAGSSTSPPTTLRVSGSDSTYNEAGGNSGQLGGIELYDIITFTQSISRFVMGDATITYTDTFARSDEDPLASPWATWDARFTDTLKLVSNVVVPKVLTNTAIYKWSPDSSLGVPVPTALYVSRGRIVNEGGFGGTTRSSVVNSGGQ